MDPSQPSLLSLGTDILTIVLDVIEDSNPRSLSSVALVSSHFRGIARYSQHRRLTLTVPQQPEDEFHPPLFRNGSNDKALQLWRDKQTKQRQLVDDFHQRLLDIEKQDLLPAIRWLEVLQPINEDKDMDPELLARILTLIPRMIGLRDVKWPHNTAPPELLTALRSSPHHVRLHTRYVRRRREKAPDSNNLHALQNSLNLHSLKITATYRDAPSCLAITQPLKLILLSCPNLRSLTLDISLPSSGCVIPCLPDEYHGFGFTNGERPPALEELVLIDYPFGREHREQLYTGNIILGTNSIGYPSKVNEEDYWVDVFDWARLRRLEAPSGCFALKLMPKLVALKEVGLWNTYAKGVVARFYNEVPAKLEKIEVANIASVTVGGITRHSQALKELKIHQDEGYRRDWRGEAISAHDLRELGEECPLLETLALDIARQEDDGWPWQTLDVLATAFPRLERLELWFELGLKHDEGPQKPYLTVSAAAMLYNYVRQQSGCPPSRLRELIVHSGSPPAIGLGYPSHTAFWPSSQSINFTCTLSERDDERAEGRFTVSCQGISYKDTELGDKVAEVRRKMKDGKMKDSSGLRLALDGPLSVKAWEENGDGGW